MAHTKAHVSIQKEEDLPAKRNFLRQAVRDLRGKEKHLLQKEQNLWAEKKAARKIPDA